MTTFTNQSKSTTVFTRPNKSVTSFGNQNKTSTNSLLLLENGFYMLQENADKIILEQSIPTTTSWVNQSKS